MRNVAAKKVNYFALVTVGVLFILLLLLICMFQPNKSYTFQPVQEMAELVLDASYKEFDVFQDVAIPAGVYEMQMEYETDTDLVYWVYPVDGTVFYNGLQSNGEVLYSGLSSTGFMVWLWEGTEKLTLRMNCNGEGRLHVGTLTVYETDKMWTMAMTYVVFVYGLVMLCYALKRYFGSKEDAKKKKTVFCMLMFIAVIASIPYLWGVVIGGADLTYHLQRIEGVKDGLLSGNFPVRLEPEWVHGHGYANAVFYCNALLTIPAVLRLLGFSVTASYCMYCILLNVLTTIISYYCFSRIFKDEYVGLMCSALYTLSVFRIYKLVITGAVGEGSAVTFMPLVLYGLYRVFSEDSSAEQYKTAWLPITFGYAGLIQTHVLSCEITAMLTIIICLLFAKKIFKRNTFFELAKGAGGAFALSAWYLIPFLDYYLTQDLHIKHVSERTIQERGIFPAQLFFHFWKAGSNALTGEEGMYHSHAMGIGFVLGMAVIVFCAMWYMGLFREKRDARYSLGKYASLLGLLLMAMSLKIFPWTRIQRINGLTASLVSSIQFPNRFLGWGTVFAVVAFGVLVLYSRDKNRWVYHCCVVVVFFSVVTSSMHLMDYINTNLDQMRLYNEEGMGFGYISGEEYKIEGTTPDKLLYDPPTASEHIILTEYMKKYLHIVMTVENTGVQNGYIEVPLIAYKGYQATDCDSNEKLDTSIGENGVLRIEIPADYNGRIDVSFVSPWYWRVAELITYAAWISVGIWMYRNQIRNRRNGDCDKISEKKQNIVNC